MYRLKPGIKRDPQRRWSLPDRIFFGYGACHILAGVYLGDPPLPGFQAEWIVPDDEQAGSHIYLTDGDLSFDYHGYAGRAQLLAHHGRSWRRLVPGWSARVLPVTFPLLDTAALNQRRMRGPDQYFADPIARAQRFLARIDHQTAMMRAQAALNRSATHPNPAPPPSRAADSPAPARQAPPARPGRQY